MVHVINPISVKQKFIKNPIKILSCLTKCPKKEIHDVDAINERIKIAAKVKQQLDADVFECNERIAKNIEAAKQIKKAGI